MIKLAYIGAGFVDWRKTLLVTAACSVALAILPLFLDDYLLHVCTIGLYYTILASSWSLLAGFTGQFSLAHQAFAALGAYTTALLIYHWKVPMPISMVSGVLMAAALGYIMGKLVLKMRAVYLAIATWAFAETLHILLTAGYRFTRGDLGLNVPSLFGKLDPLPYFYLFAAVTVVSVLIMYLLLKSPLGYFMRAIKDDELRAESLGVDTTSVKTMVFTVSSAFAGLAGVLYAHYVVVLSPQMADFNEMAKLIIMVVVGGLGSFAGPLLAALPIQTLSTYLQKYGEWDMVIYGLVVIVLMRSHMGGLTGMVTGLWKRVSARAG